MDASQAETFTNLGYIIGYVIAGILSATAVYKVTKPTKAEEPDKRLSPILTGVAIGWSDREQMEQLIDATEALVVQMTRLADQVILSADHDKQAADARIARLLAHIEEQERMPPPRRRRKPATKKTPS